jgi:hypothetical protein
MIIHFTTRANDAFGAGIATAHSSARDCRVRYLRDAESGVHVRASVQDSWNIGWNTLAVTNPDIALQLVGVTEAHCLED